MGKELLTTTKKVEKTHLGFIALFWGLMFLFVGKGANIQIANNAPFFILAVVINGYRMIRGNKLKVNYATLSLIVLFMFTLFYWFIGRYDFGHIMGMFLTLLLLITAINCDYSDKDIRLVINGLIFSAMIFAFLLLFFGKGASDARGKMTYTQTFGAEIEFEPNFLALILITGFEISVYSAIKCIEAKKTEKATMYVFCAGITFISAMVTGSRSVLVASYIFLFLLIFTTRNRSIRKMLIFVVVLLALVLFIALATEIMNEDVYKRMFLDSYNDGSNAKRINNWKHGLMAMRDNFFGFGPFNSAAILYALYRYPAAAHNTYIAFGVYYGMIGFLAFGVLTIGLALDAWKANQREIFAMVISMVVEWNILECQNTISLWIFLLICFLIVNRAKQGEDANLF